jgi:predicted lipid-binding transport protein (Tim44 family)
MKKKVTFAIVLIFFMFMFMTGPVMAQELIIYPAQGQSEDQMEKDKFECYTWAKKETGFDPMQMPTATTPPPKKEAPKGGAAKGGIIGGATGAIAGGIIGGKKGAGRGALLGGGSGAVIGGMRRSNQRKGEEQARQQWEQEQSNAYLQKRNTYNRAYGACLEGRGYTVK